MQKRLTFWFLITLVLSLGFGQLLRFEVFSIAFYAHDLLVISLLILQFRLLTSLRLNLGIKLIFLGLFLGWLRALTMFPIAPLLIPFLYTARLLAYLVLYLTLSKSKLKVPSKVFIYSGLVSLTIGLVQYFFLPDMRLFQYLGWDDHLFRLTLPHFDPTYSAAMLSIYLLSLSPRPSFTSTFLYTLGILLSYSRSIWLSIITTGIFFLKKKKLLLLLLCLPVIILALPRKSGEGTNLLRSYSISSRFSHDLTLAKQVGWNFVIGQGYNTLPLVYQPSSDYPLHAHGFNNSFLEILSTMGILGLLGWGLFLYRLSLHPHLRPIIIFLCVASLFNNLLLYPFTLLLVLLLAL
ncbi:MAG: hypothetical protein ABII80_00340, partial [bacterium]